MKIFTPDLCRPCVLALIHPVNPKYCVQVGLFYVLLYMILYNFLTINFLCTLIFCKAHFLDRAYLDGPSVRRSGRPIYEQSVLPYFGSNLLNRIS